MINCVENGIEMHNDAYRGDEKDEEDGKREWREGEGEGEGERVGQGRENVEGAHL